MRRRLRKKKDQQRFLDSIDWWFGDATDVINDYIDKMKAFRIKWRRNKKKIASEKLKKGSICPYCNKDTLVVIPDEEPWSVEHLYCNKCDSTYCIGETRGYYLRTKKAV